MNLVLSILFFALVVGLFVPRTTPRVWVVVAVWILLIIFYNLRKA